MQKLTESHRSRHEQVGVACGRQWELQTFVVGVVGGVLVVAALPRLVGRRALLPASLPASLAFLTVSLASTASFQCHVYTHVSQTNLAIELWQERLRQLPASCEKLTSAARVM